MLFVFYIGVGGKVDSDNNMLCCLFGELGLDVFFLWESNGDGNDNDNIC